MGDVSDTCQVHCELEYMTNYSPGKPSNLLYGYIWGSELLSVCASVSHSRRVSGNVDSVSKRAVRTGLISAKQNSIHKLVQDHTVQSSYKKVLISLVRFQERSTQVVATRPRAQSIRKAGDP